MIAGNTEKPGSEAGIAPKLADGLVGGDKDLLCRVGSFIVISQPSIEKIEDSIQRALEDQTNVIAYVGKAVLRFFPLVPKTNLTNPNVLILSRFGISGGSAMGHGGGSLSEVVVPAVRFSWG